MRRLPWRDLLTDTLALGGIGALAYGLYQVYEPLAWIGGGAILVGLAIWRTR